MLSPPSGAVLFMMSKVCREMDFNHTFSLISTTLSLNHSVESELWQEFLIEKVNTIKDRFDLFSIHLRKQFIDFYDDLIGQILHQFFKDLKEK